MRREKKNSRQQVNGAQVERNKRVSAGSEVAKPTSKIKQVYNVVMQKSFPTI